MVGVFDRSHYEDVVAVRVRNLAPRATWTRRYGAINRFETELAARGTTIVKCFLHISFDEWLERQLARLDDPAKHWKFNPADIDDAMLWDDYLTAYNDALRRCNSGSAPWYVIPADRKWYRNHAVTQLLVDALESMDLRWPPAQFDVEEQRARLRALAQRR
jgi:polyphosphate kinase 2 (PPK2 family)